jgi:DNA-binding response OmpR family regulator
MNPLGDRGTAALVVVVNADSEVLEKTAAVLSSAGYEVRAVSSYADATELLDSLVPDLLVVDVRLDAFNGLQLAIRSRLDRPHVPVIVTHVRQDAILEAEAKRLGVDFLVAPPDRPEFLARVDAAMRDRPERYKQVRRWRRMQMGGNLQVGVADAEARVLDISYGGARLALDDLAAVPTRFEIRLPSSDTSVTAHRVWTTQLPDGQFWFGVELEEGAAQWRDFVNSMNSAM